MYYITTMQHRKPRQITWEDVIADKVILNDFANDKSRSSATITKTYETIAPAILAKVDVAGMISWLKKFNEDNQKLFETNRNELFNSFKIPKSSGGFRPIDEPLEPLMSELSRLTSFLRDSCGLLYHTAAFAYIKDRSIVDNNMKHVNNKSNWYLKTDFSGFFPHTNLDFVMKMLSMIFPISEVCKDMIGYYELKKALSLSYKADGLLPQGSPLSPFITNVIMIPLDHRIFGELTRRKLVYTRYADDMIISGEEKFPWQDIVQFIKDVLKEFNAPYEIKKEKTRFGSVKGSNWNLGLMATKYKDEYMLTVGHRKKKYVNASINSFILDTLHNKPWSIEDVMTLNGQLSYCLMIEKKYFNDLIEKYNKKYNVNVRRMIRKYMNLTA